LEGRIEVGRGEVIHLRSCFKTEEVLGLWNIGSVGKVKEGGRLNLEVR
jgi:hypothetical protein